MRYYITYEYYRYKQWYKWNDIVTPKYDCYSLDEDLYYEAYKINYSDVRNLKIKYIIYEKKLSMIWN